MVSVNPETVREYLKLLEALEAAVDWSIVNRYDTKTHTTDALKRTFSIPYNKHVHTFR